MKTCSKCKEEKDESCFHKRAKTRDKLYCQCKSCTAIAKKIYRKANIDKILQKRKNKFTTLPEDSKEKIRDYHRQYNLRWYNNNSKGIDIPKEVAETMVLINKIKKQLCRTLNN